MFPGKLSAKEAQKRKTLALEYLNIINEIPRGHVRTAKIGMLRELFPKAEVVADDDKNHGIIRFDLKFSSALPEGKPREVWFERRTRTLPLRILPMLMHDLGERSQQKQFVV